MTILLFFKKLCFSITKKKKKTLFSFQKQNPRRPPQQRLEKQHITTIHSQADKIQRCTILTGLHVNPDDKTSNTPPTCAFFFKTQLASCTESKTEKEKRANHRQNTKQVRQTKEKKKKKSVPFLYLPQNLRSIFHIFKYKN